MEYFFRPRSVAVIGASHNPHKLGYQILNNLLSNGFDGRIYPINPKGGEILGLKVYTSVLEVPENVDLAVVVVPAPIVPSILRECGEKGVKGVAVISSGFGEAGNKDLEREIVEIAGMYGMRILGPNIFGIVYTPDKLNASFGPRDVALGRIALLSQSGALGIALMGWTQTEEVGLSAVVSLGNKADVSDEDLLDFFARDDNTNVIVIYMEGVSNGRAFMDAVKRTPKPVVVIKAGRSSRGARAVSSHTGSLAGSDLVYDGAFRQAGAIRARTVRDAFILARALSELPVPEGEGTAIITNGGGIGVMATDAAEDEGISLYSGSDLAAFKTVMPPFGSFKNPVDITGMADSPMYVRALEIAQENPNIHSIIVLYCETAVCDPIELAEGIKKAYNGKKPVITAMVGGSRTDEAIRRLNRAGIPAYASPEDAVRALKGLYLWKEFREKRTL